MHLMKSSFVLLLFGLPGAALAVESYTAKTPHSTLARQIDVNSYIVGSYNYLERNKYFTSGFADRINDNATNGARLQQAFLSVSCLPDDGFGGYAQMAAGSDAYTIAPFGWNANVFQIKNFGFAVPDAYLFYGNNGYTAQAGVMEALAGFETFSYLNDSNFSRGIIYGYVVPGVHAGVRGSKKINDTFKVLLGVANGWATLRQPGNMQAAEAGLEYTLSEKLSGLFDVYAGKKYLADDAYSGPTGNIGLFDMFGTYQYTEALSFNWNLDYAVQSRAALPGGVVGRAQWAAAAGYANYQFNDRWRTSLRGEVMNDKNGYRTGVKQTWKEATLSFGYEPIKHLSFILETRRDFSNVNAFVNKNGVGSNNNQQSYALEAMYQFV